MSSEVWCVRAGQLPYAHARELQRRLETARLRETIPDVLLLLEHPPVYTKGRRSTPEELPMGEDWYRMQGIEVTDTDRGGRVTYHGPGQLVGYPIVSLRPYGDDVHEYVRRMERLMIDSLGEWGVEAGCIEGQTGVWAGDAQDRLDRRARQPRHHHARLRDQRQQRPAAVRVDRPLRDRVLPHDLAVARARRRAGHGRVHGHDRRDSFGEIYEREPLEVEPAELMLGPQPVGR